MLKQRKLLGKTASVLSYLATCRISIPRELVKNEDSWSDSKANEADSKSDEAKTLAGSINLCFDSFPGHSGTLRLTTFALGQKVFWSPRSHLCLTSPSRQWIPNGLPGL